MIGGFVRPPPKEGVGLHALERGREQFSHAVAANIGC